MDDTTTDKSFFQKDARDIKRSVEVTICSRPTLVYVVAIADKEEDNRVLFVPCYGTPISHDVYDSVRDGFVFYASDVFEIGKIPVSYNLHLNDSEWVEEIPLPMSVIKRYLTPDQKLKYNLWRSKFSNDEHRFTTAQMLGVY